MLQHRSRSALDTGIQAAHLHPCSTSVFCHIPCPKMHYEEPQVGFFLHLHWHDCTGFSGTGLAQQEESALPCGLSLRSAVIKLLVRAANCKTPTDPGFIWSHQYIFVKKRWRMFRFLSPNASSTVMTGKNAFLSEHCINIIFCSRLHLFSAVTTHTSAWLMPVTEACNSHVPSYKPRQQVIQFPQSPPVFNPAFPLTHTSLLYSALHSKSFRDSLVLLFHFLYTEDKLWLPNSHGLMTVLQNNPKLRGHPNLFWKHYSLEDFFTHTLVYKPPAALLISGHLLFLAIKPAVSSVLAHSSCKKLCRAKTMIHQV